jgi:hypothetical protein
VILVYVGFDTVDALSFMGLSRKNDE